MSLSTCQQAICSYPLFSVTTVANPGLLMQSAKKRKKTETGAEGAEDGSAAAEEPVQQSQALTAESYTPPDPGPYPQDKPPENPVRFTPVQVSTAASICVTMICADDMYGAEQLCSLLLFMLERLCACR